MRLLPKLQKAFDEWLYGAWKFEIMEPTILPQNSYVKERNRYRVTPILNNQSKLIKGNEVIIGLTHKDICTSIHGVKDYGIVGIIPDPDRMATEKGRIIANNTNYEELMNTSI